MTDALAAITFDMTSAPDLLQSGQASKASVYEISQFESIYQRTSEVSMPDVPAGGGGDNPFRQAFKAIESLNGGSEGIGSEALRILGENAEMSPSEMIGLTMKAHYFLFQSELMANIANKSSEGIQQLFRQQS
jgi:alpha-ketoglutarate-dependent taurine dioxygenase